MATQRPQPNQYTPYHAFNFLVLFGSNTTVAAGFQEVSGMNIEVAHAEYRVGNSKHNHPVIVTSTYKPGPVTLKRGLIGALDLYKLIDAIRTGNFGPIQDVHVKALDEAGSVDTPVFTFHLHKARPIKYTAPTFNAKGGTEVAIEELVLACEDLTAE